MQCKEGIYMIKVTNVRAAFPEAAGFYINRKKGYGAYTFLHFHNSVEVVTDNRKIVTQPHAVIIYTPEKPQYFKSNEPLIHDWMHFEGDISESVGIEDLPLNTVIYPADYAFITKIIAEIEYEFFSDKAYRGELLQAKLNELFIKIGRELKNSEYCPQDQEWIETFRALRVKMFSSLNEEWSIKRMSESVFLSESRFYFLYKRLFGISPLADLINAKINSAKNMLAFNDKSVEDIAFSLNYNNTTHFIRQFKQYAGTTPAKYRKSVLYK